MLDTVHLWLGAERMPQTNFIRELESTIELKTRGENARTGQSFLTGSLKNLQFWVSECGLSIKGSLHKFISDDPSRTISRTEYLAGLELLADTLGLPIAPAKVRRVDIGQSFVVQYPPEVYFPDLGPARYFNRIHWQSGLYYQNRQRQFHFYDKIKELKKKGQKQPEVFKIPESWRNESVIRLELRYLKGINRQFQRDLVVKDLVAPETYRNLIQRWYDVYQSIEKVHLHEIDFANIYRPKDFVEQIIADWMRKQPDGLDTAFSLVEQVKATNPNFRPEYASRIKRQLKDIAHKCQKTSVLIAELDAMVEKVWGNHR